MLTRLDKHTNTHPVTAPQQGAVWSIPLDVGGEVTGTGWGQSGYVGGQGPWGYGSDPSIYYHFVIY
jgi:hypothetical protein